MRIEDQRGLTILVRTVSLVFIPLYVWVLLAHMLDYDMFVSLDSFVKIFSERGLPPYYREERPWRYIPHFLAVGLVCNFGFFFITTPAAKRFKVFATLAYAPTILLTSLVFGLRHSFMLANGLFILATIVYDRFNPWRR